MSEAAADNEVGSERRFLVLAADLWETGGIGTAMRTFVRALADLHGQDSCQVISLRGRESGDEVPAIVLDRGFESNRPRVPMTKKAAFACRALQAVRHRQRGLLIVAGHPHLAPIAWLAASISGAPYVVWVFGKESWAPMGRIKRRAIRQADLVLAITRYTATAATAAQGIDGSQVRLLRLCLPPWRVVQPSAGRPGDGSVLSVARLDRADAYKGVDTLVRAWPAVRKALPAASLTVVGDGDDRGRIRAIATDLGVADHIQFAGKVTDEELWALYAKASLFALPGRAVLGPDPEGEGFGLVFIEAQAAGVPVVAGRAAGAVEAVRDGSTGVLVDPEDPADVARVIVDLLRDDHRRAEMADAGPKFVAEEFSYERFRAEVADVVDSQRR